jgi:hypothetical protein
LYFISTPNGRKAKRIVPNFPEALLGRRPAMRPSAVGVLGPAHFGGFQAFVGHLALELHLLVVPQRAEAAHLNNALEKPTDSVPLFRQSFRKIANGMQIQFKKT